MAKSTRYVILAVIGGPIGAVLTMAIGCNELWHPLDSMCGHNAYIGLPLFTLATWALFTVFYFIHFVQRMFK